MPAIIQPSVHHEGGEILGNPELIEPGDFRAVEFYHPEDHDLLAAYVVTVGKKDLMTKVIQWTMRSSLQNYPEMSDDVSVSKLEEESKEDVHKIIYGGSPKTIVAPRLERTHPLMLCVVSHVVARDGAILL